ncbi:MAG: hypothetical protein DMF81_10350, partial [Acidobacteria bacterium]
MGTTWARIGWRRSARAHAPRAATLARRRARVTSLIIRVRLGVSWRKDPMITSSSEPRMANLAAANVMHRKTRTAVSVLAVAVEVAMVMLLVGMANGTLGDIADRLQNVGADVLFQSPDASLILGATSAVMPVKYADLIKEVDGVTEATPVLNWLVARIKGESRAVNLWAIDYPSYARISGGFDLVEGRPLAQPYDLVMVTVLAEATKMRVGDMLPMLNHEFRLAGITHAGA